MRLLFSSIFIVALLGSALSQSTSPAASPSPSASANCTTLLLNGTEPFDIFLLGSSLNSSANASASSPSPSPSSSPVLNVTNSLIGGTVAVNGSALIVNSLIGSGLNCPASPSPSSSPVPSPSAANSPASSSSANTTLLVTGDLNTTNSRIACDQQSLQVGQNITRSIDFKTVGSRLLNASRNLCQRPSDLQANLTDGRLTLVLPSNATELTVINLNASDLATLRLVSINASSANISSTNTSSSSNSTSSNHFVIINIIGTSSANQSSNSSTSSAASNQTNSNSTSSQDIVTLSNFALNIEGLNASQLLWNFCNATNIRVEFVRLQGSVLAPQAHLSLGNMGHQGSIVAGSLDASFASHSSARFGGFFCAASPSPSSSPSPSA